MSRPQPPPMGHDLDRLLDALRAHGYRITTQRRLVMEVLLARHPAHLSCDEVTAALAARGVDVDNATVYRILQWLKTVGLVAQTDLGTGHDTYSWVSDTPHHHLICLRCHRIIEAEDALFDSLRAALRERYGFQPRIEHFAIFGLCQDCAAQSSPDR